MKDRILLNGAVLAILIVGMIGVLGMVNAMTGAVVKNTGGYESYKCVCQRHEFDSRGNLINFNQWEKKVPRSRWNDAACEADCQMTATGGLMKASRDVNVFGYAKPRGSELPEKQNVIRTV